jgi:hypothetical protein
MASTHTYSCLFLYAWYYPLETKRMKARGALEEAEAAHAVEIKQVLGGRAVEWVLM